MPQLPGLDKAEGRAQEPAPIAPEDLASALAQLKEKTDAERVSLTREIENWKAKFKAADEEISRYQTAVATLVGADDLKERQQIRDGLCGPVTLE